MTGWRYGSRSGGRTRGSVSVELAILTPAFLLLIVVGIVHGRIAIAANAIDVAAHDAARAASISRDEGAAYDNAIDAATQAIDQQGLECAGDPEDNIQPSLGEFDADGLDEPAFVYVSVTCEVSFTDVQFLPIIPGSHTITSTFVSPVDIFRERE